MSFRLNHFEHAEKASEVDINLKPRKNYGPEMEKFLISDYANKVG